MTLKKWLLHPIRSYQWWRLSRNARRCAEVYQTSFQELGDILSVIAPSTQNAFFTDLQIYGNTWVDEDGNRIEPCVISCNVMLDDVEICTNPDIEPDTMSQ